MLDRLTLCASLLLGYSGLIASEFSDVEFDEGSVGEKVGCRVSFGMTGDGRNGTGLAGVKSLGIGAVPRNMIIYIQNLHMI